MPTQLTADRLRELLSYDPQTGAFTWRVTRSNRAKAGKAAGCTHRQDGYIYIRVDGVMHRAHRLAWLYVHGTWPAAGIDHINGGRAQNGIANLREAGQAENMQNLWRPHRDNKTGFMGVHRSGRRFYARIKAGQAYFKSPKFSTAQEAHAAYMQLKAIHHPYGAVVR
jgi:hypothetical protein